MIYEGLIAIVGPHGARSDVIWIIFWVNVLTIAVSFKKRMILYALLNAMVLFLITGQAFLIEDDLTRQHTVIYIDNFISDVGFDLALRYVLGISCISLALALISRGYRKYSGSTPMFAFKPSVRFYVSLLFVLSLLSVILIFVVIGISDFLHSSRPGFQTGSTIFLVLLSAGLMPLLFKILYNGRINSGDIACFFISFAVTGTMSRTSAIFYLLAILIALYYSRGWADAKITIGLIAKFLAFGLATLILFVGYGAIRGAQDYASGSIGDLLAFVSEHPEKSVLSLEWNYRFDVEGMSGIAGAFSQSLSDPSSVHHDYGVSWILQGMIQWLPGVLKPFANSISDLSIKLAWYAHSIVASGAESFFMSFGWAAVIIFPVSVYFLAWYLPLQLQQLRLSPAVNYASYIVMAWSMLFVHGPLVTWIAFCFTYALVPFVFWPFFSRYITNAGV